MPTTGGERGIKQSIVQLLDADGKVRGCGLLVDSKHVVTCAHVIDLAIPGVNANQENCPGEAVQLWFPYSNSLQRQPGLKTKIFAHLIVWKPVTDKPPPDLVEDIAVLKLDALAPDDAVPRGVLLDSDWAGRAYMAHGFPESNPKGDWADGTFKGEVVNGWVQLLSADGADLQVDKGFSGGGVWDEQRQEFAGIMVANKKRGDGRKPVSYMIPGTLLKAAWSDLPSKELPTTAQRILSESTSLAEAGDFDQAAIKAEEAYALAEREFSSKLKWKSSLNAARAWCNHAWESQLQGYARDDLDLRIEKNISYAETAGAPNGEIALAKALLAAYRRDNNGIIEFASVVAADPTCDDADRAEALAMRLQALLLSDRPDDALDCFDEVEKFRETLHGERLLLIESAWLRVLCESELATDNDVSIFISGLEHCNEASPKLRLRNLELVAQQFNRAAQSRANPANLELINARLNKLKRLSSGILVQLSRELKAVSQQSSMETGAGEDGIKESFVERLESALPNTGDRQAQTLRLLEAGFGIIRPVSDAVTLVNLAAQIAELSAQRGDASKAELFLGHCDNWVEASKGNSQESARVPWANLRVQALTARGRVFYRLAKAMAGHGQSAKRYLFSAQAALEKAHAYATEHRNVIRGNVELIHADISFWLGETSVLLGLNAAAAQHFSNVQSPAAMAHTGFSTQIGMLAWLKEAEAHCFSGDIDRAYEVLSDLLKSPACPAGIGRQASNFKLYIDDAIQPVVDWFSGPNASRIRETAKRKGLATAVSEQTKHLLDWHERFFNENAPGNLREAYDFWGRGGFSRIAAAIRAKPGSAIAVDAFSCDDIRRFARMLCPLFDTLIVKWKGAIEANLGLRVFPDPAPHSDEFGDFFGGMGLIRCMGDEATNTTVLLGTTNLLPDDVGEVLANEALPLIRSGRLILLPAAMVGCTQSAIGWTDDLLTRSFLRGVLNVASQKSDLAKVEQQSIDVTHAAIPFIDGISLHDLARVLEDASEYLLPLRSIVLDTLSTNLANERWGAIRAVERDFRDACRELEEVLTTMRSKGGSEWAISKVDSSATAIAPEASRIGSDVNTDLLRAVGPSDERLSPWVPFWLLEGLGGYLDWSCDLDNPSKPPLQTFSGTISHSWICPGTGGPGIAAAMKV